MRRPEYAAPGRTTILLGDDDELFRATLKDELVAHGYLVVEASDGAQVLAALASAADGASVLPAVLVLDVCMPELSGLGVLEIVRRFPKRPMTLLVTGFTDKSIETFATRFGAHRVFRKPVDADELLAAICDAAKVGDRSSGR
jgi:CheY-like chemotaxis protein